MIKPYYKELPAKLGFPKSSTSTPPSESKDNVIQFYLTDGCSHSKCTFCDVHVGDKYRVKTLDEFKVHVDSTLEYIANNQPSKLDEINRIFIGDCNALNANAILLKRATQYAYTQVKKHTGKLSKRLAIYGNVNDVLNKSGSELSYLRCGGTCWDECSMNYFGDRRGVEVIYLGLESGNSKVLKISGKGYNHKDALKAINKINISKIRLSLMVMPGLGGIKYSNEHVKDTLDIINSSNAEWITFLGLDIKENTPYAKWVHNEEKKGTNRRLTCEEIVEQTAQLVEGIRIATTIGVYDKLITSIANNPKPIGTFNTTEVDPKEIANSLRENNNLIYNLEEIADSFNQEKRFNLFRWFR